MEYRRFDHTIVARLDKGEEILEQVKTIALQEHITLATVQALGAINAFTWAYSTPTSRNATPMHSPGILRLCP